MAHALSRVGLTWQSDAAKGNTILIIIRHGTNTTKRGAKHTRDGGPRRLTHNTRTQVRSRTRRPHALSLSPRFTNCRFCCGGGRCHRRRTQRRRPLRFSSWSSRAQNQRVHSLGRGIRLLAGCGGHESRTEELPREGRVVVSFFCLKKRNESVCDHVGCGPAFAGESGTREILPSATRCPRCVMEGGCCVLSSTFLRAGVCGPRRWESLSLAGA